MATESVSKAIANSKFSAIAPYVRDEQYTLRDLGAFRRRALGQVIFGIVVAVLGIAGAGAVALTGGEDAQALGIVVLIVALALYLMVLRASVGLRAVSGHFPELAAFDSRAPILYLRNFASENPDFAVDTGGLPLSTKASFEHFIGTFFWNFGRVVALGDPLQRRPSGSVSRFFVTEAGWQASVQDVMRQAQAIIIHYGAGANVDWEVNESERYAQTPRLVIWNLNKAAGQKRVADLGGPAALRAALAESRQRLPAGDAVMLGIIRERKGDVIIAGAPTAEQLGKLLNRFRRSFNGKTSREELPPALKKTRAVLHGWTYAPALIAMLGPIAVLLALGFVWISSNSGY